MKSTFLVYLLTFCLTTFNSLKPPPVTTSYELAAQVVAALQDESVLDYEKLMPTINELSQLVEDNQDFYGANLLQAKADLEHNYTASTLPEMKRSFKLVLDQGKEKGIVWSKIQLESVKFGATENEIHIIFNHSSTNYKLRLEKTMRIKGEWRATQFLTLI